MKQGVIVYYQIIFSKLNKHKLTGAGHSVWMGYVSFDRQIVSQFVCQLKKQILFGRNLKKCCKYIRKIHIAERDVQFFRPWVAVSGLAPDRYIARDGDVSSYLRQRNIIPPCPIVRPQHPEVGVEFFCHCINVPASHCRPAGRLIYTFMQICAGSFF